MNEKLENFKKFIGGKTVTMIGAGISNMASVGLLRSLGASVSVRDKSPFPTYTPDGEGGEIVPVKPLLDGMNVPTFFGENYLCGLSEQVLIKTPAVRADTPQIAEAVKRGAILTSESELFCRLCPCPIYAVTGSDGKTTTTTLIYLMLSEEAKKRSSRVFLGGNIGTPLFPRIAEVAESDAAVLELSSFQLQTMSFEPYRAVITNISPNHLNWHTDMEEYVSSKAGIFANQKTGELLVLNAENEYTDRFVKKTKGDVTLFSSKGRPDCEKAVYLDGNTVWYSSGNEKIPVLDRADIRLPGLFNAENYMAAIAATRGLVCDEAVRSVARSFCGVRHRLEEVRMKDGVKFCNSSIDTTPSRTIAALDSLDCGVVIICGGSDKNIPLDPLIPVLAEKAKFVCATGTTGKKIFSMLADYGYPEEKRAYEKDFEAAVRLAASKAERGDCVLLSPAAASFDSFRNFERRGDFFCEIVKKL